MSIQIIRPDPKLQRKQPDNATEIVIKPGRQLTDEEVRRAEQCLYDAMEQDMRIHNQKMSDSIEHAKQFRCG